MAEIISMPRLSDTMEEGTVVKWHKNVGDQVSEGDILAEIETDKAIQEFESEFDGTLLYAGVEEGSSTKVDEILAIIGNKDEDISAIISGNSSEPTTEETTPQEAEATSAASQPIPEGVEVIAMPRLSDTMEEGTVAKWHKNVGDQVAEGDILAEIETDKAVQEFESEFDGTLLHIGSKEGEASKVDAILAIIGPAGTDVTSILSGFGKAETSTESVSSKAEPAQNITATSGNDHSNQNNQRILASPLAKKIAQEKNINLNQVQGSGDNGRIIKRDIENFKPTAATTSAAKATSFAPILLEAQELPNSQMRKVIAKRLSESKFTAPHYYLNIEVNMDNAIAMRKELNNLPDTKISFNDMVVKAVAMALRKHPKVNSTWYDDKILQHGNINVGVAVAIDDGLLVPVLKNTDQLSYLQINEQVKDLATRSKERTLKADEMEGSTFTVSNLGAYGIESFTSIINQPNSCILSVGAIVQKPIVKDGQIVVGNTMKLTMACDHRTVDGATGSLYLQTLKQYLEQPMAMLL